MAFVSNRSRSSSINEAIGRSVTFVSVNDETLNACSEGEKSVEKCCRMLDEDGPIIYGLDEQTRCMRGYTDGVQETAQFIVGTQTLKRDNMV